MAYIERAISDTLRERVRTSKCVLVTGARQVGKSTVIRHEFPEFNRAIKTPKIYFRDTGLACYLTKWLTADALKCSAVAGSMFETFVVSEILKSYVNEGRDYRFHIYYYRGKDKGGTSEVCPLVQTMSSSSRKSRIPILRIPLSSYQRFRMS